MDNADRPGRGGLLAAGVVGLVGLVAIVVAISPWGGSSGVSPSVLPALHGSTISDVMHDCSADRSVLGPDPGIPCDTYFLISAGGRPVGALLRDEAAALRDRGWLPVKQAVTFGYMFGDSPGWVGPRHAGCAVVVAVATGVRMQATASRQVEPTSTQQSFRSAASGFGMPALWVMLDPGEIEGRPRCPVSAQHAVDTQVISSP